MDPITTAMGLAQFAPSIIKLFTGSDKAAEVAGKVVDVAKAVTGSATGDDALEALKGDLNKVIEFRTAIAAQQADLEKAYLLDVQDARHMQDMALQQDDLFSKRFVYYFAAAWSLFSMAYFLVVTFLPLAESGQRIADTILGVLIASVIGVMFSYFYGTNKSSQLKTNLLASKNR